jgi:hypothetical protein
LNFQVEYPLDRFDPDREINFSVTVLPDITQPAPGTAKLHYRINEGAWQVIALTSSAGHPNFYRASIPSLPCLSRVEYYFSALDQLNQLSTFPVQAPLKTFFADVVANKHIAYKSNFLSTDGWSISGSSASWFSTQPIGNFYPDTDDDGSHSYMAAGSDPDLWLQGQAYAISPSISTLGGSGVEIKYSRWTLATSFDDEFEFFSTYSTDSGHSWHDLEVINRGEDQWVQKVFRIDHLAQNILLKLSATNSAPQLPSSASIDAVEMKVLYCQNPCPADMDGDFRLGVNDFMAFINAFAAGNPSADFNHDTRFNIFDFTSYLAAFHAGCAW